MTEPEPDQTADYDEAELLEKLGAEYPPNDDATPKI